jgi:hypothetical protein
MSKIALGRSLVDDIPRRINNISRLPRSRSRSRHAMQMPYQRRQQRLAQKTHLPISNLHSRPTESIKPLISIPNKRQTHLRTQIITLSRRLRSQSSTHIRLRNLINREVLRIDITLELRLKRSTNTTETIPLNTAEEGVLADFGTSSKATETIICVADEASSSLVREDVRISVKIIPSNEVLCIMAELLVWGEVQVTRPIHNLPIRIVSLLSTEWWPADQTFEHDCTKRPPITAEIIALTAEDLRSDVVRSTNSRVGELSSRLTPCVYLLTIADRELNLIKIDRGSVVTI